MDIDYFNPIVPDWTPECIDEENRQKEMECNVHLYYITSKMTGVYSIAEAVDSAHNQTKDTIFVVDPRGFDESALKSLDAVGKLILEIGGSYIKDDGRFVELLHILAFLHDDDSI